MLRLLVITGCLLMVVGFGAAGWQYWQEQQRLNPSADAVGEVWLATPTGGIVPAERATAFLDQIRLVPGRMMTVTLTAPLATLLQAGEPLPDPAFHEVMADIRAPLLATPLCEVVIRQIAADCAVHSARVVPGSLDPALGTARFRVELAYRLKPDDAALPDIATQVFSTLLVEVEIAPDPASTETQGVEAALLAVMDAGSFACTEDSAGYPCRILGLTLDWSPGLPYRGTIDIGWLDTLPDGVFPAPVIGPAPEG